MNPPLRLCGRNPLDTVNTTLILQPAVGPLAFYQGNDLFESTHAREASAHDLHSPAVLLRIFSIHPEKVGSKEPCLISSGSCPDLKKDVLLIVGIFRKNGYPEILLYLLLLSGEPMEILLDQPLHLFVFVTGEELKVLLNILSQSLQPSVEVDHLSQFRKFPGHFLKFCLIVDHFRLAQEVGECVVPTLHFF